MFLWLVSEESEFPRLLSEEFVFLWLLSEEFDSETNELELICLESDTNDVDSESLSDDS